MLLLLLSAVSDPAALMLHARARLAAPCDGPACVAPPRRSAYRIEKEAETGFTAKDRAIRDDGSKCNVVGARRCPKRGRTILRTAFGQ